MSLAQMSYQLVAKSHQSILMSEHHPFHFSRDDAIHQPEKLFALKIESSSNFEHPLIHLDGLLLAKLLQRCLLVLQVWFLRLTGHPAVGDSGPGLMLAWKPERRC